MNTPTRLALFFPLFMLIGCADTSEPSKELIDVYSKVVSIRETIGDSVTVQQKIDSVLAAANYSTEKFDKDLRAMSETPKLFKSFYDSISARLSVMRTDATNADTTGAASMDSLANAKVREAAKK